MKLFLAACLLGVVVAVPLPGEPPDGILPTISEIKGIVSTDYGFKQVKAYLLLLKSDDPIAQRIRDTIHRHTDEELKEAFNAFFAKIPYLAIDPVEGFEYPTLDTLFGQLKNFLSTDAGVAIARTYMELLETDNEILKGILSRMLVLKNEELKTFFGVMFSHVPDVTEAIYSAFYDVQGELGHTAEQLKAILTTSNGIQQVRDHLKGIQTTNPTLILAKTVLSAMSDASLIDLVKELLKNIKDVPIESDSDLLALFLKGKDLIVTDEGIKYVRNYLDNLQTGNFLIVRVKNFVKSMSDQEMKDAIERGSAEIFGKVYFAFFAAKSELEQVAEQIKALLIVPEGIQQVRDHLKGLQTTNPTIILVKTVLSAMSDNSLIDIIKEISKDIEDRPIDADNTDLLALILKAIDLAVTDEGLKEVRDYFDNLQTSNFLIVRVKTFVKTLSDEKLKEVIKKGAAEIFGQANAVLYAAYEQDLRDLFTWIKHNLQSKFYFQQLIAYLSNLKVRNVYVMLGKEYFLQMSEDQMREIVDEFLKNFPEIAIEPGFDYPDLLSLFVKVKAKILTSDGLAQLREYAAKLESNNSIVQELQAALLTVDDQTLTGILVDLFQGI